MCLLPAVRSNRGQIMFLPQTHHLFESFQEVSVDLFSPLLVRTRVRSPHSHLSKWTTTSLPGLTRTDIQSVSWLPPSFISSLSYHILKTRWNHKHKYQQQLNVDLQLLSTACLFCVCVSVRARARVRVCVSDVTRFKAYPNLDRDIASPLNILKVRQNIFLEHFFLFHTVSLSFLQGLSR